MSKKGWVDWEKKIPERNHWFEKALTEIGWTKGDFACRAGVSIKTVYRWCHSDFPHWVREYLRLVKVVRNMGDGLE